ncbi:hypothetical protein GA0115255_119253 [Streptomyces sp. Ncost-T6T-2b]|nr:hypothetical protein GA0115255_119253 [Streptomyces sp. Ncost-T6T-2b]
MTRDGGPMRAALRASGLRSYWRHHYPALGGGRRWRPPKRTC